MTIQHTMALLWFTVAFVAVFGGGYAIGVWRLLRAIRDDDDVTGLPGSRRR